MKTFPSLHNVILIVCLGIQTGCTGTSLQTIPQDLQAQVDSNISFKHILNSPVTYQGPIVVLGGKVLSATRTAAETRVTVLKLPLTPVPEPVEDLLLSQGRFIAYQPAFLDHGTLPPHTPDHSDWRKHQYRVTIDNTPDDEIKDAFVNARAGKVVH